MVPLLDADISIHIACAQKTDFIQKVEEIESFIALIEDMFDGEVEIYLTGRGNFRKQVDASYKAQRPKSKPRYHGDLREYLITFRGAIVRDGYEADDLIASRATTLGRDAVIVSSDKDYLQIPNTNIYNPRRKTLVQTNPYTAAYSFYSQMLAGDTADNVKGIKRIGPKTAAKLLEDKLPEEMEAVVRDIYQKKFGKDATKMYDQTFKLLWLLRDL